MGSLTTKTAFGAVHQIPTQQKKELNDFLHDTDQDLSTVFHSWSALTTKQQKEFILKQMELLETNLGKTIYLAKKRAGSSYFYLEEIRDRAPQLEDKTRVYRTRDGKWAFTDTGRLLTEEEKDAIEWLPGNPSWEERVQAGRMYNKSNEELIELEASKDQVSRHKKIVEKTGYLPPPSKPSP